MLDATFVRTNLDAVRANCANRNVKADLDAIVRLDDERKRLVGEKQILEQRKNDLSAQVKTAKDAATRQPLTICSVTCKPTRGISRKPAASDPDTAPTVLTA